jgi:hypothetical protein
LSGLDNILSGLDNILSGLDNILSGLDNINKICICSSCGRKEVYQSILAGNFILFGRNFCQYIPKNWQHDYYYDQYTKEYVGKCLCAECVVIKDIIE